MIYCNLPCFEQPFDPDPAFDARERGQDEGDSEARQDYSNRGTPHLGISYRRRVGWCRSATERSHSSRLWKKEQVSSQFNTQTLRVIMCSTRFFPIF